MWKKDKVKYLSLTQGNRRNIMGKAHLYEIFAYYIIFVLFLVIL